MAEAGGNTAPVLMTNVLWDLRDGSLHRRIEKHFSTHALRDRSNRDHEDILGAIRKHDSPGAANLMRRNLTRVERELSRAWPTIAKPAPVEKKAPVRQRRPHQGVARRGPSA